MTLARKNSIPRWRSLQAPDQVTVMDCSRRRQWLAAVLGSAMAHWPRAPLRTRGHRAGKEQALPSRPVALGKNARQTAQPSVSESPRTAFDNVEPAPASRWLIYRRVAKRRYAFGTKRQPLKR